MQGFKLKVRLLLSMLVVMSLLGSTFMGTSYAAPSAATHGDHQKKDRDDNDEIGFLLIDFQQYWWNRAANPDKQAIAARGEAFIKLAKAQKLPMWITYEASKEGEFGLPKALKDAAKGIPEYVKMYFNSVAHADFAKQIRDSGIEQVVLAGAETDVCVAQTALGLVEMGLDVYLLKDTVFSTEANVAPALKRLEQAGVKLITFDYLQKSLAADAELKPQQQPSVKPLDEVVKYRKPGDIGTIVVNYQQARVDAAQPKNKAAIIARMQQMYLALDIYGISRFYMVNDHNLAKQTPANHEYPLNRSEYTKTGSELDQIAGLKKKLKADGIQIVALSGVMTAEELQRLALDLREEDFDVYVLEDALLSPDANVHKTQQALYDQGVIPMTYKMMSYELWENVYPFDQRDQSKWNKKKLKDAVARKLVQAVEILPPIKP
ncbi:isochorismatase family protein [Paenibacillus sp. 481]|uniref:isochorismatase family protein n=1 Tax=Paenibacillus sp. 481 TaxID=2835869 RepID=UPI001E3B86FA|nr:isochorismatase family protein [Paenibacillus sp. 481]UHA73143.1 isochorismatase family protein [Paenibacillus sp. 481]